MSWWFIWASVCSWKVQTESKTWFEPSYSQGKPFLLSGVWGHSSAKPPRDQEFPNPPHKMPPFPENSIFFLHAKHVGWWFLFAEGGGGAHQHHKFTFPSPLSYPRAAQGYLMQELFGTGIFNLQNIPKTVFLIKSIKKEDKPGRFYLYIYGCSEENPAAFAIKME